MPHLFGDPLHALATIRRIRTKASPRARLLPAVVDLRRFSRYCMQSRSFDVVWVVFHAKARRRRTSPTDGQKPLLISALVNGANAGLRIPAPCHAVSEGFPCFQPPDKQFFA